MDQRVSYRVFKPGSLDRLARIEEAFVPMQPNEVVVAVKSIGLNYADIFAIMGLYSATPNEPFIPGLEFAGEIVACGETVTAYKVGDKVFGVTRFGAYTTHITIGSNYILPLPKGYSLDESAAFPVQGLTAYYALKHLGDLQPNQSVLIQSGAGGVGILANRIAKKFDAFTIGVVGSEHKFETLSQEGYDRYLTREGDFEQKLKDAMDGRDLNLVLESSGGKYFKIAYHALAPMGRLVTFGSATFTPEGKSPFWPKLIWKYLTRPKVDPMKMVTDNKSVMAFNLIWLYQHNDLFHQLMQELMALNIQAPLIGHTYTFDELPRALHEFKAGNTVGKLVIQV